MFGMLTNEQIIAAQKAQLEAFHELATHYVSSVEKLTALNLRLTQGCLQDSASNAQKILDSKGGHHLLGIHHSTFESISPRVTDYCKHLFDIASTLGHGLTEVFVSHADKTRQHLTANSDEGQAKEHLKSDS